MRRQLGKADKKAKNGKESLPPKSSNTLEAMTLATRRKTTHVHFVEYLVLHIAKVYEALHNVEKSEGNITKNPQAALQKTITWTKNSQKEHIE